MKLIAREKDAVVLFDTETGNYKVKEFFDSDIICITPDEARARERAKQYDFSEIVTERRKLFEQRIARLTE